MVGGEEGEDPRAHREGRGAHVQRQLEDALRQLEVGRGPLPHRLLQILTFRSGNDDKYDACFSIVIVNKSIVQTIFFEVRFSPRLSPAGPCAWSGISWNKLI